MPKPKVYSAAYNGLPLYESEHRKSRVRHKSRTLPKKHLWWLLVVVAVVLVTIHYSFDFDQTCDPVKDVKFLLYTRRNPDTPAVFDMYDVFTIQNSKFNKTLPTRYIIHGWNGDRDSKVNIDICNALFTNSYHVNVIVVEWKRCASSNSYDKVRKRLRDIAIVLATFMDFIEEFYPGQLDRTEVIGHSFGAHIAGIAAKYLISRKTPASILGLDPAGKEFSIELPNDRLDKSDARYVEVIHTSAEIGFREPIGTIDVYPFYGNNQPGCDSSTCDHNRAIDYFVESINSPQGIVADQCLEYLDIIAGKCRMTGTSKRIGGEPMTVANRSGVYYFGTT